MNVLIICGSGNKDGFTAEMCRSVALGIESEGENAEILYPLDLNLSHCTGCEYCAISGKCIQNDDMGEIYRKFGEADILIMASPIRFSGPTSIVKMITDRFQPYWFNKGAHPKYFVELLCGGRPEPNFSNTTSILKAWSITTDMEWGGQLFIPDTDSLKIDSVSAMSFDFGKDLVKSLRPNCS